VEQEINNLKHTFDSFGPFVVELRWVKEYANA